MSANISPQVWGPKLWKSLHYIAYAYPEAPNAEQQRAATELMQSLAQLLPCAKCRQHYTAYLSAHPPAVASRSQLALYINQLHNSVNERLGKTQLEHDPSQAYVSAKRGIAWGQILVAVVLGILVGLLLARAW